VSKTAEPEQSKINHRRANAVMRRNALTSLPVIDVSPFMDGGSPEGRWAAARRIREACIDIGFFYIQGHGFAESELADMLEWGRRFFALPLDRKMAVAVNDRSASLGFLRVGGLNPEANTDTKPDRKERLFLSRDVLPGESPAERSPAGRAQWPSEAVLPGFTNFVKAQIAKRLPLARALGRGFALSLELAETYFDGYYDHLGCMCAFNYYPPEDAANQGQWGFSPHTDYGSFTIVQQDDLGGLQARNSAGQWIDVPPLPGTFVVNVGDLLARWTNDFYVSTLHRVRNVGARPRVSNSFFVYPDVEAEIRCLETCHSAENPPRYEPVNSGAYIEHLLAQAYRTGRVGISSRTAERLQQSR
jgi:isopenicillin N synthase-like dioxygenase